MSNSINTLEFLERIFQFTLAHTSVTEDGQVFEKREAVGRINNIKLEIHPNDHPPPHLHIRSPEINAKVAILTGEIIRGSLDRKTHLKVKYFLNLNKKMVVDTWNNLRPTNCLVDRIEKF